MKKETTFQKFIYEFVVNTAARLEWWINQIKIPKNITIEWFKYKDIWKMSLKGKNKEIEIVEIIY